MPFWDSFLFKIGIFVPRALHESLKEIRTQNFGFLNTRSDLQTTEPVFVQNPALYHNAIAEYIP